MKAKVKKLIDDAQNRADGTGGRNGVKADAVGVTIEPVYTIAEVAKNEKLSREFVRRRFFNEPGVRRWGNRWRIPHSVLLRVMQNHAV